MLEFWWTIVLLGATIIGVLVFLHETAWDRERNAVNTPPPQSFVANRFATFFPGTRVTPSSSLRQTVSKHTKSLRFYADDVPRDELLPYRSTSLFPL